MTEEIIEHEKVQSKSGQLVAALPQEGVRSLFHLLTGKPDSVQKTFNREIIVTVESIVDLHDRINEKLRNHHIEGLVASVDITYDDNTTAQFGSWSEFTSHRWTGSEATKEALLKWDFLVSMPEFEMPQRHTLTVRLSREIKPMQVLQSVFSRDPEDMDSLEIEFVPMFVRVDFINHILSKELISIVEDWNKSLQQPLQNRGVSNFLKKHGERIKGAMRNLLPILSFLVAFISIDWLFPDAIDESSLLIVNLKDALSWGLAIAASLLFVTRFSSWLASHAERAIYRYGRYTIFSMTNGDKNEQQRLNDKNRKQVYVFLASALTSVVLNVVAGVIVVKYFTP